MSTPPFPSPPAPPQELQVSPHIKGEDLRAFCPSLVFNDRAVYGHDKGNGLVYPQVGDEPVQEYPDRPFFWIQTNGHWVAGNLWDWLVKGSNGQYYIVPESTHHRH